MSIQAFPEYGYRYLFRMNNKTRLPVLLLAWLLWPALCAAQDTGPALVELAEAEIARMAPTMQVAGTVVSRSDAYLSSEVEGRLEYVSDVGTRVSANEVVAHIEDTSLRLRAQELEAEIRRSEARLRFLEGELKRFESLVERNLIATSQLDQTRSERDVAASELAVARSRLAQTRDMLDRTRLQAPFPGVIAERLAQIGERVAAGDRVVRVVNPADLEVIARAPLDYYDFVRPGDVLDLTAAGRSLRAPVRTLVSVGDEARHVFELRLDLETSLPVGQTVRVTVPMADVREVLAVPRDALVLRGDGVSVFIIDEDNRAQRIRVSPGIGSGDLIEVNGPIQAGDRVVIRGNERLRPGQAVQLLEG